MIIIIITNNKILYGFQNKKKINKQVTSIFKMKFVKKTFNCTNNQNIHSCKKITMIKVIIIKARRNTLKKNTWKKKINNLRKNRQIIKKKQKKKN